MNVSKWYLLEEDTLYGRYALIIDSETGHILSDFPALEKHKAEREYRRYCQRQKSKELKTIIKEHNKAASSILITKRTKILAKNVTSVLIMLMVVNILLLFIIKSRC